MKKEQVETYNDAVKSMIKKGFADNVPDEEIACQNPYLHYLPHHPVIKKTGAIIIVFDCANKFNKGY